MTKKTLLILLFGLFLSVLVADAQTSYNVTLNWNGGTGSALTQYNTGTAVFLPEDGVRTGYTFVGWFDNSALTGPAVTFIADTETGDKEFWAKWELITYWIEYEPNGGMLPSPHQIAYNIESPTWDLPTVTKAGYTFKGWFEDPSFTIGPVTQILTGSTGDKSFFADWSVGEYTVTLHLNGGVGATEINYTFGVETVLPIPTRAGYEFAGWYLYENLTGNMWDTIPVGAYGNRVYWAKWNIITYTITYNLNGGTDAWPDIYNVTTEKVLPIPTRAGYEFAGWYDNENLTGEVWDTIKVGTYGNKDFWAKWLVNGYTITYHLNGGEGAVDATYDAGNLPVTLPIPTRAGYDFAGWYDNENLTGEIWDAISVGSSGDKEFWAKWIAIEYTIYFHSNGGSSIPNMKYTVEDAINAFPIPIRAGFKSRGWYDNEALDGNNVTSLPVGSTGDREYWHKWDTVRFTITATAGSHGAITPSGLQEVTYGKSISFTITFDVGYQVDEVKVDGVVQANIHSGYTFTNVTNNHTIDVTFKEIPPDQLFLTLQAYPVAGGSVIGSGAYDSNAVVDISAVPNAGWRFVDWTNEDGTRFSSYSDTIITLLANTKLIANFEEEVIKHQITASVSPTDAGTIEGAGEYVVGSTCTLKVVATSDYWQFVNWTENGLEVSTEIEYIFVVDGDRELVANFDAKPPVIVTHPESQDIHTGETLTLSITVNGVNLEYQWIKDNVDIVGANNATYVKDNVSESDAGDYNCRISNGGGEVISEVAKINVLTGISDDEIKYIRVLFDGKDQINLDVSADINISEIILSDLNGQVLYLENTQRTFNLLELPSGAYWLRIKHSLGAETHSFLKIK